MNNEKVSQVYRVLSMYERLKNGEKIHKSEEAARFHTSEKSIQRNLQSIRDFIELENTNEYLDYDRSKRAYVIETASRSDEGGNYFCLDLDPLEEESSIVYWSHERNEIEKVANNLNLFLDAFYEI
ncbi:hypothetical protein A9986_09740 [Solibacillus silvestris]|nr:SMI1/KNR4 family protein [Solibacillus silvestris]OBW57020.1 hypothetical protein A9986_09740 [Solibacillus silvestris]